MHITALEAVFESAFNHAIRKVGYDTFKRTSFFASNQRDSGRLKKAA